MFLSRDSTTPAVIYKGCGDSDKATFLGGFPHTGPGVMQATGLLDTFLVQGMSGHPARMLSARILSLLPIPSVLQGEFQTYREDLSAFS